MQMWHIPTITLEQTENNKWCNRHVSIDKSVQLTISKTFFGCFRSLYATHTYINSLSSVPKQTICTLCISLLMSHQHLKMVGPSFVSYFGQHQSSLWCFFFFFFLVTLLFNPLQPFHWALEKYRLLWIWTLRDYVAMIAPWQNSIKSTDATQLAQRAHSIITQTKSGPIKGSSFCHSIWMEWIFCF